MTKIRYFRTEDAEVTLALPVGPVRLNAAASAAWLQIVTSGAPPARIRPDLVEELEEVGALDDLDGITWIELPHLADG